MDELWNSEHPSEEETAKERLDRNFAELLQEMRVAQTGVQILLGFLLTMVFASGFADVKGWELWLYAAAVCLTTLAMGLLVAPVPIHRLLFRRGMKPHLVRLTHLLTAAGLVALLLAVSTAVSLALVVALGATPGLIAGGLVALTFFVMWYLLPLVVRQRHLSEDRD